jgi:hypothetical protein
MNMLRRLVKIAGIVVAVLLLAVVGIAFLPPWWGKAAYLLHVSTDIPYQFRVGALPRHFSGIWRDYGRNGRYDELSYKDGRRDGSQRYYDEKGNLIRSCEFRNGMPWSGLCDFWQYKPWLAEYRDGKLWKGAMQEYDDKVQDYVIRYYFEGRLYSEAEFRQRMAFGDGGALIGIMWLRPK